MKAAVRRKYCSPDQIKVENLEIPSPKDNEVLVRVHATTVNRTDCANLTAKPFIMRFILGFLRPRKIILGTDFAGEVVSIGSKVTSIAVGERVFGFDDLGANSQAEFMIAQEENTYCIPKDVDFEDAAASLEGAHYAYSFIHKVDIKEGQNVLINGASGGIGSALIQFLSHFDVKVDATCSGENIDLIRSLGADKVFDYTKEDFTTTNEKYDFVFDSVGKSTFAKCRPLLNKNGVYISSELGPYSQNLFYPLFNSISSKKVIFPIPYNKKKTIPYISNQLAAGKFKPVIDRSYELDNVSRAYEYVISGQKTGNVVILMPKDFN